MSFHLGRFQVIFAAIALVVLSGRVQAQTFQTVPALSFTMPAGGANPLPQIVTIASTSTAINYAQVTSTTSGGGWLSVSACSNANYPCTTPYPVTVAVLGSSLAAGTYQGQVVFTNVSNSSVKLTVPVTLTVTQASAAFFDNLPGALSYSFATGGNAGGQVIQIRNGGSGTLKWSLAASTASGGNWLSASASSGTAPTTISVSITKANLPGGGSVAGTYVGQLLLRAAGDSTTIPVAVTVGTSVFRQVNPISFTMPFGGASPLPQILSIESTNNAGIPYIQAVGTGKGGNWLSIPGCNNGNYPCYTPYPLTVSVVNASSLAAGTYTGEVVVYQDTNPQMSMTVPVTLNVVASGAFFNNLPGGLSFSVVTNGIATSQVMQIGNGGTGTLSWTVTASTSDTGTWLTTSSSGTAPSLVTAGVDVSQLPGGGSVAGTYTGQLLFQTKGDATTVPVAVTVGSSVFTQVNPISFTMPVGGASPLPQLLTMESTNNAGLPFIQTATTATGGSWLSVPGCNNGNYPCYTPYALTVSVVNASSLAAGTYTGEVVVYQDTDPQMSAIVPVTLNVVAQGAFFNNLPGGLSFSLEAGGAATSQTIAVEKGGTGPLEWTAGATTADGSPWLTTTPASGTAPTEVNVSVTASLLPGGGQIAGTFIGQLLFETAGDTTTIPVAVTVASNVFTQVNPISFTMPVGGASPLPQILTIGNSIYNSSLPFIEFASTATGGNWLSVPGCNDGNYPCYTPYPLTASVINASSLAAGTYTGEITIYQNTNPQMTVSVPVTLNVVAAGAFFDNLPGQLSFTMAQGGTAVTPQALQIGNAGTGTLKFKITPSTSDGGAWLKPSAVSGSGPKTISIGIVAANLPGAGALAGTFTGQLLLQAGTDTTTIPVTVVVGNGVFTQMNPLNFVMAVGGSDPLPQILTVAGIDDAKLAFTLIAATAKGGNWLSVPGCNNGNYPCYTPYPLTVAIQNASTLALGTYTGEITIYQDTNPALSMTVPVILTVAATDGAFFDNLPGQTSFSFAPGSKTTPSQTIQIGNGGEGTLNWTIATNTADTGKWLKVTPATGTNAGSYAVSVTVKNLPGGGAIAGTFAGQEVLETATGNVTIPVAVTVATPVFVQLPAVSFRTTVGVSPVPQTITISSTGAALSFVEGWKTGKGGGWLSIPGACTNANYPCTTPSVVTVSVNASGLAAGTYFAEINLYQDSNPAESMTIPVVLTVSP